MQGMTPALTAILKSKLQIGDSGYGGRVEIDIPSSDCELGVVDVFDAKVITASGNVHVPIAPTNGNDGNVATITYRDSFASLGGFYVSYWTIDMGAPITLARLIITSTPDLTYSWGHGDGKRVFDYSANGTDWTRFVPTQTIIPGAPESFVYDFDAVEARYWRLGIEEEVFGFTQAVGFSELKGFECIVASGTVAIRTKTIGIDKSLRMAADQAVIDVPNEDLALGWGPECIVKTNMRMRLYQWYGDPVNEVRSFTGLVDRTKDHRDVLTLSITARDMFAILIDPTFSAIGPQGAKETGRIRTEDNGVYLNREVSYIVADLVRRAGWPAADVQITPTSYVLDEFLVRDGASYAATIIGNEQLTGLVGYAAWADELGVFHFAPTSVSQNITDPVEPVYTFRSGEDIVSLDDEIDQANTRTRVKVRGPLTTQVLEDTWRERWRTSKFHAPVGLWYNPGEPTIIRVLDRGTKRMYRLRQSDRAVLGSVNIGAAISHPLGLSGDPADASIYWVLNAPWIYTGSPTGNSVKKVRKSDSHVLATYAIPNGRWSALKVSSAFLWLTNLDTDRFYKRSKADGSAIANYQHTYHSVVQANPSGMMIDGTTLYLFWSNGGTTARFLVCDEAAPGTVVKAVKTAGTALHGGEMDTTTHIDCYGDSDSLGLVAKFTLAAIVDQTKQVFSEVVDSALEDELGLFAQLEPRAHDTHPGDPAHAYEVRRLTLDLKVITSLAQATETAMRQLDLASVRARALDVGILANPALQKTDPVEVVDPVTGLSTTFAIDTYRSVMSDTYLGTLALLPIDALDDDPTDDGDAS